MVTDDFRTREQARWEDVKSRLESGRMTQRQAAEELGVSRSWLNVLLRRDNPRRKDRRAENMRRVGRSNRKPTNLENIFTDASMCKAIRAAGKCDLCPKQCNGQKRCKGLLGELLERSPK